MEIWGYEKIEKTEDDYEPKLMRLKEMSLLLSFRELSIIREFLENAEKELRADEEIYPKTYHHVHFRDWYPGWREGDPDIVINVNMSLYPPEES